MYAYITGNVTETTPEGDIVLEAGNIGYSIRMPLSDAGSLSMHRSDEPVKIYTYLYVREGQMSLYGFLSQDERELFAMIIGVGGMGPKSALSLLSSMGAGGVLEAIAAEDVKGLSAAPGIGKKTAGRLVLELKDRAGKMAASLLGRAGDCPPPVFSGPMEEAAEALVNLGYTRSQAVSAVKRCGGGEDTQAVLKKALACMWT